MSSDSTKILYIEDDRTNRTLVRKLMSASGYRMLEAEDGISGIDVVRKEKPDLILMDMNMPGLDGYETSTRIKGMEGFESLPIIAVTANALDGDRERSLIAGCDGYISKPIDPDTFVSEIESYLGGKKEQVSEQQRGNYLQEYSDKLVRRMEQKVRDLSEALDKAERASQAKSRFLGIIGHELRTPLNAIINAPDLVRIHGAAPVTDKQGQLLSMITRSGKQLLGMIDNVLQYTELEDNNARLNPVRLDVRILIGEVIERFRAEAEGKGLTIGMNCCCPEELPLWNADRIYVSRVLELLVENAVKFTTEGSVKIDCRTLSGSEVVLPDGQCIPLEDQQMYMQVCVSDTGIGIDPANIDEMFSSLSQQDDSSTRRFGGIGIGLAIARRLIAIHGGHLWASGEPGKGAQFCFALPQSPLEDAAETSTGLV